MKARQVFITKPFEAEVRDIELPGPRDNQILAETEVSAISPGTELAVWTGTHQWLQDPKLPEWKFPFRLGYSAAGTVLAVGPKVTGWKAGDRVSYPGNHASAELLTIGHERGRLWKLPAKLDAEPAALSLACDGGQVVVVGSPRGKAKDVNFYDDLHRRYIEVTGAHGNMLFEAAHTRLAGAWDIDKAQRWLLATLANGRLKLDRLI